MNKALALSLALSAIVSMSFAANVIHTKEDVRIKQGNSYTVELESNPTTGYMWELNCISKKQVVTIEELPFKSVDGLVGGSGIQSWEIIADHKGTTSAVFDYKQPWTSEAVKTKTIYIIVE